MAKEILYFDLETQRTANDVGGWDRKHEMGMSLGVVFSSLTGEYEIYPERRANDLVNRLLRADLVVGYNIVNFDYAVLLKYSVLDLAASIPSLDLLIDIEKRLGHRLKLEALAQGTLGLGKIADGIDAIRWWREGRLMEIAEYCCFDVKVTRLIHEHGAANGSLSYLDTFARKQTINVDWTPA